MGRIMTFTEPRSDIHDLAPALEKLVREKGRQKFRGVFKRLPDYIHLSRGDLRWSLSRRDERMWQTQVRNLSRNQNRSPKYDKYPPIPNCALEYIKGWFILREPDDPRAIETKTDRLSRTIHVRDEDDAVGWLFDVRD